MAIRFYHLEDIAAAIREDLVAARAKRGLTGDGPERSMGSTSRGSLTSLPSPGVLKSALSKGGTPRNECPEGWWASVLDDHP